MLRNVGRPCRRVMMPLWCCYHDVCVYGRFGVSQRHVQHTHIHTHSLVGSAGLRAYLTIFLSLFVPCPTDGPEISQKQEEGTRVNPPPFGVLHLPVFLFSYSFFFIGLCTVCFCFCLPLLAVILNPASRVSIFPCLMFDWDA